MVADALTIIEATGWWLFVTDRDIDETGSGFTRVLGPYKTREESRVWAREQRALGHRPRPYGAIQAKARLYRQGARAYLWQNLWADPDQPILTKLPDVLTR